MELTPDQLDDMMMGAWGDGHPDANKKDAYSEQGNLESLVAGMKSFVENVSSFEGAETPQTKNSDRTPGTTSVNFNPEDFLESFGKISRASAVNTSVGDELDSDDFTDDDIDDEDIIDSSLSCSTSQHMSDPVVDEIAEQMASELSASS